MRREAINLNSLSKNSNHDLQHLGHHLKSTDMMFPNCPEQDHNTELPEQVHEHSCLFY